MRCHEVDAFIEDIASGDTAVGAVAAHLEQCPRCRAALANASAIERTLHDLPAPVPPPDFARSVVARIRRERWRAEQVLDWGFNVAVGIGVLLVVGGLVGVAWASDLTPIGVGILSVLSEGAPLVIDRVARESQTILLAALLLTMALGLWWWVESEPLL